MSSGKVHRRFNNIFTVGATGGALVFGGLEAALPVFVGCVAGTAITPDYDLNANLPSSLLTKLPIISTIWKGMWRPYQELLGHRSFFSHFPIVGTTGRILYLGAWIWFFLWVASALWEGKPPEELFKSLDPGFWLIVYVLWCAQDFIHFLLDL